LVIFPVEETDAHREKNPEVGQMERGIASQRLFYEEREFYPRELSQRKNS
jgi:hypothetical protein